MAVTSTRHFRSHVIVWFLLIAGLILTITGYSIYTSAEKYLVEKFQHQQKLLAEITAGFINGKTHSKFINQKAMNSRAYQDYENVLKKAMALDDHSSFIYSVYIKKDKLYYALIPDIRRDKRIPIDPRYITGKPLNANADFNQLVLSFYKNQEQSQALLLSDRFDTQQIISLAMITDQKQNPIGVVIVEVSKNKLSAFKNALLESMLVTISMLFIVLLVASVIFARKITSPFEKLTDAIERLIKNDFNFTLSLADFGGFVYIAKQFNLMLLKLQVSRNDLVSINKAYSRFVPHQILKLISPNGIKTTSLGDCIEKEMTILFCDIRGFTTLSESMMPSENFAFINRYLKIMVPVINKHGGTIDKYMGDGIMALFPNSADNALDAAVGMMGALDKYNLKLKAKNLPVVEIGLGLHTGRMMLGTVGTSSRMDVTVVSDTVNAAARIESLTKTFHAPILISEELRIRLNTFDKQNLRFIATCFVKGKSKPMTIYEVFSQDAISIRKEKLDNQNQMIKAWELYKKGESERSVAIYQRLMERSQNDKSLLALIEVVQNGRL